MGKLYEWADIYDMIESKERFEARCTWDEC